MEGEVDTVASLCTFLSAFHYLCKVSPSLETHHANKTIPHQRCSFPNILIFSVWHIELRFRERNIALQWCWNSKIYILNYSQYLVLIFYMILNWISHVYKRLSCKINISYWILYFIILYWNKNFLAIKSLLKQWLPQVIEKTVLYVCDSVLFWPNIFLTNFLLFFWIWPKFFSIESSAT